jgi:hypothetical protein
MPAYGFTVNRTWLQSGSAEISKTQTGEANNQKKTKTRHVVSPHIFFTAIAKINIIPLAGAFLRSDCIEGLKARQIPGLG